MRTTKAIQIITCHAEGEVGDVIVGGVSSPPGATLWEQSRHIATDGKLRAFVLNEPRGGVFRHVNLLVPPKDPSAYAAFIIMEPEDTPPMSGSNSICVELNVSLIHHYINFSCLFPTIDCTCSIPEMPLVNTNNMIYK